MIKKIVIILFLAGLQFVAFGQSVKQKTGPVINFNKDGKQVTRFSTMGDAIDAHDGEIAYFDGTYYLYGTSYDCGFEWGNKDAPFCGFKAYASKDMVNWTDKGFLFDAQTPVWQSRCNGNTYGCFRPHVIYNKTTKQYVLWINVYDNRVGFRVFVSAHPAGPFAEVAEPTLAVNNDSAVAGLNNGDHDTFIDDDGTAYIAYTDWHTKGTIVIEKLSDNYLTGTGEHVKAVTSGSTEAPGMFKRNGIYYVLYSDPNCGYCSGTGTSYKTAKSPLGPWSEGIKISDNSCGGQPSFVSVIKLKSGPIYLYGSDLWNNAAKNEALANFYWAPLTFTADGAIEPMKCMENFDIATLKPAVIKDKGFITHCDIGGTVTRMQTFTTTQNGVLTAVNFTTFKTNYPDAPLQMAIFETSVGKIVGSALSTANLSAAKVGWSAKSLKVNFNITVKAGQTYALVVSSAASRGCYGFAYNNHTAKATGVESVSTDKGVTYTTENGRTLKFKLIIR
jgi:hypothetical protein